MVTVLYWMRMCWFRLQLRGVRIICKVDWQEERFIHNQNEALLELGSLRTYPGLIWVACAFWVFVISSIPENYHSWHWFHLWQVDPKVIYMKEPKCQYVDNVSKSWKNKHLGSYNFTRICLGILYLNPKCQIGTLWVAFQCKFSLSWWLWVKAISKFLLWISRGYGLFVSK